MYSTLFYTNGKTYRQIPRLREQTEICRFYANNGQEVTDQPPLSNRGVTE